MSVSTTSADTRTRGLRAYAFASLRLLTGFAFLRAFLDKTFGFGYATSSGKGWIDGGSPTKGFLSGVAAGPMESAFHSWAGAAWADWLFMAGLLGIGLALVSGIALGLAAVAGTVMMALMWIAEWPPAKHAKAQPGQPEAARRPVRVRRLGLPDQQVGLGDHADHLLVGVDHGQPADAVLSEEPRHVLERRAVPDADDLRGHHGTDLAVLHLGLLVSAVGADTGRAPGAAPVVRVRQGR